jgi:hypothetical protein
MKNSKFISHVLFWLIYYGIEFLIEKYSNIFTKTSILRYFLGVIIFYIMINIFKKSNVILKINLIIYVFFWFLMASLILKYETINLFQNFTNPPISVQILYVIDSFVHLFFLAFIYITYKSLIHKHRDAIETENLLFEIETNYLNSKIDVHFFFNSINIFYAHFIKNESNDGQKLIKLSNFVKKYL